MRTAFLTLLVATAFAFSISAQESLDQQAPKFSAILLGTGIPLPNPERACAATLIIAGDRTVLVDTGRGALTRLVQAGYQDVSMILYTHFHSDHIGELGEVMVNRSIDGADKPMRIHGPKGTQEVVDGLLSGYKNDNRYRKEHHKDHWNEAGMRADVTEHEPGVIYDEAGLRITMFNVDHEPVVPAVGYRFDFGGKSIVISGDTKPVASLIEAARGCDVLIHEAVDLDTVRRGQMMLRQRDPRRAAMIDDMVSHHTGTHDLARLATEAGVKKLVITHLVPSIPPTEVAERNFARGMAELYSGPIILGRDLMKIEP